MLKFELKNEEMMDTSEISYEGYGEEGEIHSSEDEEGISTRRKMEDQRTESESPPLRLQSNEDEERKKLQRAKRFAIPVEQSQNDLVDPETISRLYKSLGIDKENEKHYRFNAIHMRGTQNMSTNDVLGYFSLYSPSHVEWINDVSCNVIWSDNVSAAKALLNISKEIKNLDKIRFHADPFKKELQINAKDNEHDVNDDAVDAREIEVAIPPGSWRIGDKSEKSQAILLRVATRSDKKQRNAEKNSEYYKKYGNPHFGNIPGIVSNSLRSEVFKKYKKFYNNDEHGDKNKRKNPWGHLAVEWSKLEKIKDARTRLSLKRQNPSLKDDLRLSINSKYMKRLKRQNEPGSLSLQTEPLTDEKGKFLRMKMYADDEENNEYNSFRNRISTQTNAPVVEDLRLKIVRSRMKKEMLDQGYKNRQYWNRYSHAKVNEYYNYEDYNDNDFDDYGDDEEKGSTWALEQYSDLRESLEQNKKGRMSDSNKKPQKYDSDDKDDISDDIYNGGFQHRSPLQIEFENDEYFENDSF